MCAGRQANGRQSQGPATSEGLDQCHDSPVRHGFYSKQSGEAMRVLGEDPAELEQLLESLRATWSAIPPSGGRAGAAVRMEETSFRQIAKFTGLLLRLKVKEEAGRENAKKSENEGRSHDVVDNKGSASVTHDVNGATRSIFCPEAARYWDSLVAGANPIMRKNCQTKLEC